MRTPDVLGQHQPHRRDLRRARELPTRGSNQLCALPVLRHRVHSDLPE